MSRILLILAEGFEEVEALTPIDILRRLGHEVVIAGLSSLEVCGAHKVRIKADILLNKVQSAEFAAVILPGGMPGAKNLYDSDEVLRVLKLAYGAGAILAAICASPIVLARAGLLAGTRFTAYPGFEEYFPTTKPTGKLVEQDGRIITGCGPGAAIAFSGRIAAAIGTDAARLKELAAGMFINF